MFALKKETDYAVQLLQYLHAKNKKFVSLREFSKKSGISFWFLQKIARKLNMAGIVEAEQGVKGGYRLRAPIKNLNLYKIFQAMEGRMAITPCCLDYNTRACASLNKNCTARKITANLNKAIISAMRKVKI